MSNFSVNTEDINELVPIGDKLIVAVLPKETMSKGGIVIPDTANMPAMLGHVLAAGQGIITETGDLIPMPVKRGDLVAFTKYAGTDVKSANGSYLIMRQDDVIAILVPERRMNEKDKDVLIAQLQQELTWAMENGAKAMPVRKFDYWLQLVKPRTTKVDAKSTKVPA